MSTHHSVRLGFVPRPDRVLSPKKIKITHVRAGESNEMMNKLPEGSQSAQLTKTDAINSNSTTQLFKNQGKTSNKLSSVSPFLADSDEPKNKSKNKMPDETLANNKKQFSLTPGNIIAIIGILLGLAAVAMSTYVIVANSMTTIASSSTTTMMTLRWNTTGITIAGNGTIGVGANQFNFPFSMAFDSLNALYVGDLNNSRVQKWASNTWTATTVAGQSNGSSGTNAFYLNQAGGFALDSSGNIYIADMYNSRIQYWPNGASSGTTIVGTGMCGNSTNQLCFPYTLIRDSGTGTLYIADTVNQRVVRYLLGSSTGTVVAGGNGQGMATNQLNYPIGLYYDNATSSLVIANGAANNIVRWVIGGSNWTLLAGSASGNNGTASNRLSYPVSVTFDLYGNMYVADTYNHRIQFFSSGSQTGKTIAGVGGISGSNSTLLKYPYSLILDDNLNLYVADSGNQRIQKFLRY